MDICMFLEAIVCHGMNTPSPSTLYNCLSNIFVSLLKITLDIRHVGT